MPPMTLWFTRMAASGSPTPATASWPPTKGIAIRCRSKRPCIAMPFVGGHEGHRDTLQIKEAVYRVDKSGKMEMVTDEAEKPNGLCFSPDYRKLYLCDTGKPGNILVYDVVEGRSLRNRRQFVDMVLPGKGHGLADGIRADAEGNIWAGSGWAGAGYDGVHVFAPDGARIGMILLPEICANLCFGGTKRNRLFMAASQSLYALYVETTGAHIA